MEALLRSHQHADKGTPPGVMNEPRKISETVSAGYQLNEKRGPQRVPVFVSYRDGGI